MKVFVSSLISGHEALRQAVQDALRTLRHEPIMAEDFGARTSSPQIACLDGVRRSDLVILLLGAQYGASQPGSSLSATHEEYREARGRKPVLAFVQDGVAREPEQAAFLQEVQGWEGGLFRGSFKDEMDLRTSVTRALHDYELANAVGPVDPQAIIDLAKNLATGDSDRGFSGPPVLYLATSCGPLQQILRPAEIEAPKLTEDLHQAALFGEARLFDRSKGVDTSIDGTALVLEQDRGASVRLDEQGSVLIRTVIERPSRTMSLPVVLEETVHEAMTTALSFTAWTLERIDPTQRLTHAAIAARIAGGDYLAWRSRQENDESPNSVSMGMGFGAERGAVVASRPRAALRLDRPRLVEDLIVPLRRMWKR